ncbi:hypothetical protein FPQ18DRAFT_337049 [Pyronema domesticum]|nr:hypothetical protein FPQ18DRAFT_337049 [Pyronema domesticum]
MMASEPEDIDGRPIARSVARSRDQTRQAGIQRLIQRRASSSNAVPSADGGSLPSSVSPSSNGHTSGTTTGVLATEIQLAIERRNNVIAALQAVRRLDANGRRLVIRLVQAVADLGVGDNFITDFINDYTSLPIRPGNDQVRTLADPSEAVDEIIRGYNTLFQQVQDARGSNPRVEEIIRGYNTLFQQVQDARGSNLSIHDRSRLLRVQRLLTSLNDLNSLGGPNERSGS